MRKNLLSTGAAAILLLFCMVEYLYIRRLSAFAATSPDRIVETRTWKKCENDISTTHETRYVLYGTGLANEETIKHLHSYIRSITSKQAPGGVHLTSKSGRKHFSQIGASQFVDRLLKQRRHGVFVECGAADGEHLSNSLFFELQRNWTGVLIEGNPTFYKPLLSRNRNAYVVRSCLSTTSNPQTVAYRLRNVYSGIYKSYNSSNVTNRKSVVDVQCFPLNSILDALSIYHIDYLSLDVEGAELDILNTIEWTRLTIDVMTVEYNMRMSKLKKLRSLLNGTFTEVALLPMGRRPSAAQDVVFTRAVK